MGSEFIIKVSRKVDAAKFKREFLTTNELYNYNNFFKKSLAEPILLSNFEKKNIMVSKFVRGDTLLPIIKNNIPQLYVAKQQYNLILQFLKYYYSFLDDTKKVNKKRPDSTIIVNVLKNNFHFSEKELNNINNILHRDFYYALQHGDFTRHNVLQRSESITVIDWTDTKIKPLIDDYFHFAINYFLQVRKNQGIDGILDAFNNTFIFSNEYSQYILKVTKEYFSFVGININEFYNYLILFLVERCIDEVNKLNKITLSELPSFAKSILQNLNSNNRNDSIIWYHILKYAINNKELQKYE